MDLSRKIIFWLDYGSISGMGHVSRCRGIIEYLLNETDFVVEIHGADSNFSCELEWLANSSIKQISGTRPSSLETELVIIDSYKKDIIDYFSKRRVARTVIVTDRFELFPPASGQTFHVQLECIETESPTLTFMPSIKLDMKGTMIWNSQMERVYLERGKSQKLSNRKREILITLGGSSKIVEEINQICAKIKELQLIELLNITVCVNESILEEITSTNTSGTAFNFQVFGENYYQKLISADLLLCASGTSATEAYHLGVPSIIFSLFENARKNFSTLQEFFTTAVFLDSSEDLTPRVIELYLSELEEGRRSSTPTRVGSINKTQVKTMLNFLLDL